MLPLAEWRKLFSTESRLSRLGAGKVHQDREVEEDGEGQVEVEREVEEVREKRTYTWRDDEMTDT